MHVNVAPSDSLSNRQPKAIYPSSPILAKKLSLNKGPNCDLAATGIMTKITGGMGHCPGKMKSCHQKNIDLTSAMAERLAAALQKIEVEQKCVERRKYARIHPFDAIMHPF